MRHMVLHGIATTIQTPPKAQQQQCTMVVNDDEAARREWPWADSSFGDHYETPKDAYRHLKPLLKLAAKSKGIEAERLRIYDPYYCRGKVKSCLEDLGFPAVIHEKRDSLEGCERANYYTSNPKRPNSNA